ncbi:MAG TPA: hypothetical protein VKY73_08540 [Polyangiaceae bacterium]|nr:hypothetical protein [Polyangiaceae bacterium]
MARLPKYSSFADFEREEIRPSLRIGWSVDEIESEGPALEFDADPFEAALVRMEEEEDDE